MTRGRSAGGGLKVVAKEASVSDLSAVSKRTQGKINGKNDSDKHTLERIVKQSKNTAEIPEESELQEPPDVSKTRARFIPHAQLILNQRQCQRCDNKKGWTLAQ